MSSDRDGYRRMYGPTATPPGHGEHDRTEILEALGAAYLANLFVCIHQINAIGWRLHLSRDHFISAWVMEPTSDRQRTYALNFYGKVVGRSRINFGVVIHPDGATSLTFYEGSTSTLVCDTCIPAHVQTLYAWANVIQAAQQHILAYAARQEEESS